MPLPPTGERDAKQAEQLARDLFQKLALDPDSQSLLSRLYGRLPVEVVSLDGMKAFDEDAVNHARPKTDGAAVLLSLHVAQPGKELSYHGDIAEVYGYQWAYSSTFSLGSFVRQRSDDSSVPLTAEEALQYDPEDQDDRPLLWIVANDYLLRHERPWQVIIQAGDLPHHKASADAAELRAEVNRQLESLAPAHEKKD